MIAKVCETILLDLTALKECFAHPSSLSKKETRNKVALISIRLISMGVGTVALFKGARFIPTISKSISLITLIVHIAVIIFSVDIVKITKNCSKFEKVLETADSEKIKAILNKNKQESIDLANELANGTIFKHFWVGFHHKWVKTVVKLFSIFPND